MATPTNLPLTSVDPVENRPFDADVILGHLGKYGRFQLQYFICMAYAMLFPTAIVLSVIFTTATPAHRCYVPGCDNETDPIYLAPWMSNTTIESLVQQQKSFDWKCQFQNLNLSPLCVTEDDYIEHDKCDRWVYDKSVVVTSVVTEYDIVCKNSLKSTSVSVVTMLGMFIGTLFLEPIPNRIGRRKGFLLLSLWLSGFAIGSSFIQDYSSFIALRFFIGMGIKAVMQTTFHWGLEAMNPEVRMKFTFFLFVFQAVGNLIMGLIAYLIRDWRIIQLSFFSPIILLITYYFFLPESTVWLIAKKRFTEAKVVFEKAANLNRVIIPAHLITISQTADRKNKDVGLGTQIMQSLRSCCLQFKTLGVIFLAWLSASFGYYGLSFSSANMSGDLYLDFVLIIAVEIPAFVMGMFFNVVFGKRIVLVLTLIGGGVSCLTAGLVPQDQLGLILTFSLIGKFFITLQLVTISIMTSKLTGENEAPSYLIQIGISSTMGKAGGIFSPIMAAFGAVDRSLPYKVFGGVNLAIGILTLMCFGSSLKS